MLRAIIITSLSCLTWPLWSQQYYFTEHSGGNPAHAITKELLNSQRDDVDDKSGDWQLVLASTDTPQYSKTQQLPIAFKFQGSAVSAFKVSSTGFLTFDTTVSGVPPQGPKLLPSVSLPDRSVVFWGLRGDGENDRVVSKVFGSAPNRQLWIKFASFGSEGDTSNAGTYNYLSVVLEEGSDKIHLVFMHQGQASGEITAPLLNPGVQVNSSTATSVNNSTNTAYLFEAENKYSDNFYYTFTYGNQVDFDLELKVTQAAQNVVLGNLTTVGYQLRNYGSKMVDSTTVFYTINGGSVQQRKVYPALEPSGSNSFTGTITGITVLNAPGSLYTIKIWVSEANNVAEINRENDTAVHVFACVNGTDVPKKLLIESATASWCNTCPQSNRQLDALKEKYKDTLVVVQHHSLDEMAANNDTLLDNYFDAIPEAMFNRISWTGNDSGKGQSLDSAEKLIGEWKKNKNSVPAVVNVKNIALNESTGEFTYEVTAVFSDYFYGELSLGGMVVEDNVRGTGAGFSQNIKNTLTDEPTDWYYRFSNPIFGYYHNNVVWNLGGGALGSRIPAKLHAPGDTIRASFSYTFPELLKKTTLTTSPYLPIGEIFSLGKPRDMKAVGYLSSFQNDDQQVANSDEVKLWNEVLNVVDRSEKSIRLFPNPTQSIIQIAAPADRYQIQFVNMHGQAVASLQAANHGSELFSVSLAEANLAQGIYWLRMVGEKGTVFTEKVIYIP